MMTHVALLRAVNVGGRNKVAMSDLRRLFAELGFAGAHTLLQSGNVIFDGGARGSAALERLLEARTAKDLGVRADYLVRTVAEIEEIVARNPFRREARSDPGHLLVMFFKEPPGREAVKALAAAIRGPEVVRVHGRQAYVTYPAGVGRSKLTLALIESKLRTRGTGRNWNTVLKLLALGSEGSRG